MLSGVLGGSSWSGGRLWVASLLQPFSAWELGSDFQDQGRHAVCGTGLCPGASSDSGSPPAVMQH